ncbi:hypothetical protein CPB84DRAFT_726369 [Gymnopilus junonius]|uniref:Uncharacterized protein n=1 Tax=Gymnopilus junonius TaxID=109634 RepID=A0A9P5NSG0_GYMJU|nr:hypothetical protein CPB84DRAFT_726369 [Gymnopilus junonius]
MKVPHIAHHGLVRLGRDVYLRKPQAAQAIKTATGNLTLNGSVTSSSSSFLSTLPPHPSAVAQPSIVLIFGWMGAKLPHVLKYSNTYSEIYPESTQVIVRSEPSYFWSSKKARITSIEPVVETLEALGCLPPAQSSSASKVLRRADVQPLFSNPAPSILVHTFSNGGAWQLATLSELLSSRTYPHTTKLSPGALILDSCPGDGGVEGTINAFSGLIHNPILRHLVTFIIRLLYFYGYLRRKILPSRSGTVFDRMKTRVNTPQLLPWFTKDTPRLYFYSTKDDIIPIHEVETHVEKARERGLNVRVERFEDSKHVAHARADPERYWSAVRKLWEDAVRGGADVSSKSE